MPRLDLYTEYREQLSRPASAAFSLSTGVERDEKERGDEMRANPRNPANRD